VENLDQDVYSLGFQTRSSMLRFCPLASGSKGNCLYIETPKAKLLIDAGISARMVQERLAALGVSLHQIDAILVTHEHTDHIQGLKLLAFKMGIPVFANSETAKGIVEAFGDCPKFKIFSTNETFEYADLVIHPFSVPHDTLDPVAFTFQFGARKLGICADVGFITPSIRRHLQNCDILYLEANHQPSMVHASSRPPIYKQRVLSRQGHLSNEECARLLCEVAPKLKAYLAHLSSECNHPDVALNIVQNALQKENIHIPCIEIAYQEALSSSAEL
jgi:phosphoribosyl 1,2-cyclic phosphodiesterase